MNRYLLLILLTSWSLLVTEGCDTGVAFSNSSLSVTRSSLANADVALLESYTAENVEKCMEDCCSGKYGACSIASFKKNTTKKNCLHFNCRPLRQCKFVSSSSTDSFTFSSIPHAVHTVPSSHASTPSTTQSTITTSLKIKSEFEQPSAVEEIATFSDEQSNLKNDNTSIKARKGVIALSPDVMVSKSGIKPRKGVTLEDVPHSKFLLNSLNKSNVKPRKGVGTYTPLEVQTEQNSTFDIASTNISNDSLLVKFNSSDHRTANELVSELAKLFEDDPSAESSSILVTTSSTGSYTISPTSVSNTYATTTPNQYVSSEKYSSYSTNSLLAASRLIEPSLTTMSSLGVSSSVLGESTSTTELSASTLSGMTSQFTTIASAFPSLSAKAHLTLEEPKSMDKTVDPGESENSRKYKSSMHLVLSLVFGLVVLFAVLGVVAKRMYDSWQRRDYYRMNYLIDGIYNGHE